MRLGFLPVWVAALALLSFSAPARGGEVFRDDFDAILPTDDINPGANDEPDRQAGSAAPLDYIEGLQTGVGGLRPNLTQVNNPDYPDAILLAPSMDAGFEQSVFIRPDHDFVEAPGPGGHMKIRFEANPVHPSAGVQVAGDAPIVVTFVHGLQFQVFDGGEWKFIAGAHIASGDLDAGDSGGTGGTYEGYHAVEIELITDAFVFGNSLEVRVRVDGGLLPIDTDGTPTVYASSIIAGPSNLVSIAGRTDPTAPGKSGPFTIFTLHSIDDLAISTGVDAPVPAASGLGRLFLAAVLLGAAGIALRAHRAAINRTSCP